MREGRREGRKEGRREERKEGGKEEGREEGRTRQYNCEGCIELNYIQYYFHAYLLTEKYLLHVWALHDILWARIKVCSLPLI